MSELLLELFSEEIPARMQGRAAEDLRRLASEKLAGAQLVHRAARAFVTPRRIALHIEGLPSTQPDVTEERRGPRVGAPAAALEGFLKSAGIASIEECEQRDTGKGVFYIARIHRAGRPTAEILPELLSAAILELPWPKSMRFPAAPFRWVRPLASAICLFDGHKLPLELGDVPVGNTTRGHRFLAPEPFAVRDFDDYTEKLRAAFVELDQDRRRERIAQALAETARGLSLSVKDDPGLLEEVTGLVEHPIVLAGRIDPGFMDLPAEVLTTSMRTHQKYFALLDAEGGLAPRFLLVANNATRDGGAAVVAGNERVLRARLSDARFFWDLDRQHRLENRVSKLAERIFHAKLGSVLEKVERIVALSEVIAPYVPHADSRLAQRAGRLAKADLSSGMVGEFPELQGIMGRYYARHDGEDEAVAEAIAEHYSPLGPNDRCPTAPTSVVVALADKIDTLVGFFSIGEKPTGSKDPYALRRAALGIIRLILENGLRLPLAELFNKATHIYAERAAGALGSQATGELLEFFADRLKVHLREQGIRHDLIAAVFALGGEDDLVRLLARVAALDKFLRSEDGANLLIAYRRAANIVRIEEAKDKLSYRDAPLRGLLAQAEEENLAERLSEVERLSAASLAGECFAAAMEGLATLRAPVDEFFAHVTVNCDNPDLRANRLRLLSQIRETLNRVADFSQIEG